MEKLFKTFIQFFFLLLMFIPLSAFSAVISQNKSLYFGSTGEANAYCLQSTGDSVCGVPEGHIIGGKRFIRTIGKTVDVYPDPYTLITSTEYLFAAEQSCPPGTRIDRDTGQCVGYSLSAFDSSEKHTCPLNPIEIGTGEKIQNEMDIPPMGIGQVFYERYYGSRIYGIKGWSSNYTKGLVVYDDPAATSGAQAVSKQYPTLEEACANGWSDIQGQLTGSWAKNSSTVFSDGKCYASRDGAVTNQLPIMRFADFKLADDNTLVELKRPQGTSYQFQYSKSQGRYAAINGAPGELQRGPTKDIAWRFISNTGVVEDYLVNGKLVTITTNGVVQTLTYDSNTGHLVQVQDSLGGKLTFNLINATQSSITDKHNKTTSYIFNESFQLTGVKRPDNTLRLYHYEDERFADALTGITDERGERYATWSYDAKGRAISSEHAGGADKGSIAFNADGSSTLTESLGKQTIYRFNDIAGARRVVKVEGQPTTNCAGANQNYTYTNEGWLASKTDWKGNKTTYSYNPKGQEISRTEAFGTPVAKTITTEWHATLNLKTKITEPDRETILNYDANGLLLNQKTRSLVAQ